MYIEGVIKKSNVSRITEEDQRGRHEPANQIEPSKMDLVKRHILSIPSYESHYCREKLGDSSVIFLYSIQNV